MRWMVVLGLSAGVAFAHAGVMNPTVMARMDGMSAISAAMKLLGQTNKGVRAYDQQAVEAALASLEAEAARIPALFEAQEGDPKSEALPIIWSQFDDFRQKAAAMQAAADQPVSPERLQAVFDEIGATCKACHRTYRQ